MIYHVSYRIEKGPAEHIYATKKVCEKKKKQLIKEHGEKIKFSRISVP